MCMYTCIFQYVCLSLCVSNSLYTHSVYIYIHYVVIHSFIYSLIYLFIYLCIYIYTQVMYTTAQHDNIEKKRFLLEISPRGLNIARSSFSFWDSGYYCLLFVFSWQLYCRSPTTFESMPFPFGIAGCFLGLGFSTASQSRYRLSSFSGDPMA